MPAQRTPRDTWVQEGLVALAADGVDSVRVESLAKRLGVTKGGFYGYFRNRDALLHAMLDTWERTAVDEVLDQVAEMTDDPIERARLAGQLTFSESVVAIDLAVRSWARRDSGVMTRLRRVDDRRMQVVRDAVSTFCDDPAEVEARSLLAFCMAIGTQLVVVEHPGRTRTEVRSQAASLLLRTSVDAAALESGGAPL